MTRLVSGACAALVLWASACGGGDSVEDDGGHGDTDAGADPTDAGPPGPDARTDDDASTDGGDSTGMGEHDAGCTPSTCAALSAECGAAPDGCGGMLSCGECSDPATCTSSRCVLPHEGTEREQLNYVAIPHPDDEVGGWSLIEESPANYNVFIHLTRGEATSYCTPGYPGYNPGTGEAPPGDRADYASEDCKTLRMGSTRAFYEAMTDIDDYIGPLGARAYERRAVALPADAPGRGCTVSSDRLRIRPGPSSALVFFDLGDGNLTRCEVEWAISQVRALRGTDWLPDLPEWSIVGASFYNESYPDCIAYPHSDHKAVHEALWHTDFGTPGPQYGRTCRSDPDTERIDTVDQYELLEVSGSTRVGPAQVYYGWLRGDRWPTGEHDDVAQWSRNQAWWIRH